MADTASGRPIGLWIHKGLLTVAFLGAGGMKLADPEQAAENFAHFGYPAAFAMFIGLCEVAGAIGIWLPRLAGLAAAGLSIIMLGAIGSHLMHDPLQQAVGALVVGGLSMALAWRLRGEIAFWNA